MPEAFSIKNNDCPSEDRCLGWEISLPKGDRCFHSICCTDNLRQLESEGKQSCNGYLRSNHIRILHSLTGNRHVVGDTHDDCTLVQGRRRRGCMTKCTRHTSMFLLLKSRFPVPRVKGTEHSVQICNKHSAHERGLDE